MKFVFLLIENSVQSATERAAAEVTRKHGIKLDLKFWTLRQLSEGSPAWPEFEQDFKECDMFVANMVTLSHQVAGVEKIIKQYGPLKPERSIVVMNSMPSLMNMTRLGDFEFTRLLQFMKNNPVTKISGFVGSLKRLVTKDGRSEAKVETLEDDDPDEGTPRRRLKRHKAVKKGMHNGMVNLMRTLPNILKLLPGQAQDVRAYLMIMLYWVNSSPENLEEFFKFAIDHYIPSYKGPKLKSKDPVIYPRLAIFHPDAPDKTWETREDYDKWLAKAHPKQAGRPRVGIVVMRALYLAGNRRHIIELIKQLEEAGAEAVPCYAAGLDFRPTIENYFLDEDKKGNVTPTVDLVINMSGFSLVGGPAENDASAAVAQFNRVNRPLWSVISLFFQSEEDWRASRTGLNPVQAALQVAVPELDGASEPRVFAAGVERGPDKSMYPLPDEVKRLARRAARQATLSHVPNHSKKIAVVLFSFPPNKGNVGTAAYLGVFESLYRLMKRLKQEGYNVEVPANAEELRNQVVEGNSAAYGTSANLHTHLSVTDYQRHFPYWSEIEPYWGPPPGALLSDGSGMQVLGRQFGNLLVGIQPSFGYEDDPMRLLMATNASPHHGFAAFYAYLDKIWRADAVLHFGTHGAMEFMPGKQVGLSAKCWPDRLIGDLPNFYLYSVNNPSEGTIAKRRGYATIISYLSPPMETAGLYRQLIQLKDTLNVFRKALGDGYTFKARSEKTAQTDAADSGGDKEQGHLEMLIESIVEQAAAINLKPRDVDPLNEPEKYSLALYNDLLEIEERLIPSGLHIIDEAPDVAMLGDMLNSIGSFSRGKPGSDEEAQALTDLIATGLGFDLEEIREKAREDNNLLSRWEKIEHIQRQSLKILVEGLTQGHAEKSVKDAARYLHSMARVDTHASEPMFEYLAEVAETLKHNAEIKQIIRAFNGEYIEPSPGNDIVRNPEVLPTGRNIHGLDPALVPSPIARRNGERSAKAMLERAREEINLPEGQYPETIAMVLWGTDNIKSDGEGVAQALYLLGTRATTDGLGKISNVKLLTLKELGRPRIDIVCTVSGIFRDLMPNQMELIDRAVRLVAQADEPIEMNYVRKHVLEEVSKGMTFDEACARVFSNAPGQYGANVNFMVDNSSWENDDELSEAFLNRKSFAYGIKSGGENSRKLMEAALTRVELSFQNVDSAEVGITDVDHYYEYLGGVTKAVEKLTGGKKPAALVADSISSTSGGLSQGNGIKSLDEAVRLESRTKLLNPKWYESMLKYGYEGVREIETRVSNTFGWSATAGAVDNWVYSDIDQTFIADTNMRERLTEMNPYSFKGIVGRLLEANGRGFWEADASTIERLKDIYAGLEDEIEGLGEQGSGIMGANPNARTAGRNL
ncbi:magnesium chelatase subunit H [Candidatus Chlorohelix sp.]|uniref:magnesium chelatase subunit H n=1 Tax=Candidatus Chlorohelix sp. TaxID=3139201 RepID=UPI00304D6BDE